MALPFGATLLQLISVGAGAVASGTGWAWSRAPLSRARRRARAALRPLEREARVHAALLGDRRRAAESAAAAFCRQQRAARTEEVPLTALRDAGARNVRWSALEQAGFRTLGDVLAAGPRALADVHGVGRLSASRLRKAARALAKRVDEEPPGLPDAQLSEAGALPLALGAVALLEAQDVSGPEPAELASQAEELSARLAPVADEARFTRWLVAPFRGKRRRAALAEAESISVAAEGVASSGLLERARAGRERLAERPPMRHASPDAAAAVFRDRYAECCAVLEQLFHELRLGGRSVSTRGQGGVTDEVARRVEAQALDTSGLKVTLRRYQGFGARYVLAQERTILGDEMGLGKTMQALAAMCHLSSSEGARAFCVVAPASLLPNWCREISTRTALVPHLVHGDDLSDALQRWTTDGGVAVTSYDTLRRLDLGAVLEDSGAALDLLVVDEAHFVKNPLAGRSAATRRLADRSTRVCFMSGTPMENRPEEFLELIDAVRPGKGTKLKSQQIEMDAAAGSVRRFHEAVSSVYLRRNQEDVLTELPEKIEVPEWVQLSPSDRAAYDAEVAAGNFMGMRQAATVGDGSGSSAKLDRLEELLDEHRESGRRVIVFSYFLKVLAAVHERFGSLGVVQGSVPVAERQELVDALGATEGHALLLLQITAGGQGLNIQAASAVVLMEPQTKPSTEAQAIARAHRMGQTRAVIVHRLLAHDTADASMLEILAQKQELFDAYARKSLVKEASRQATEKSLAAAVVAAEKQRLAEKAQPVASPSRSTDRVADEADAEDGSS